MTVTAPHLARAASASRIRKVMTSPGGARLTSYLALLGAWFLLAVIEERVPSPPAVAEFLWNELTGGSHGGVLKGEWVEHILVTMERFGLGLVIALVAGVAVGIIIGSSRYFYALLNDTLLVFLALPAVIWAFITVIWFGIGWRAPVWTVVLAGAPFVAVNVSHGVQAIGSDLRLMSKSFGVPLVKRIRHLILPAVTGYIFAGFRFAVIIGWNGVLLAEWFGSAEGVGWRTRYWYDANRYQGFVGWILLFIVIIVALDRLVLTPLQRRAFRWRDLGSAETQLAGMLADEVSAIPDENRS